MTTTNCINWPDIDWQHVRNSCRRQLRLRGINDPDRTQDAVIFLLEQLQRNPGAPVALCVWRAAGWSAEGRSPARDTSHGYIDALNPLDSRRRDQADADDAAERERERLAELLAAY